MTSVEYFPGTQKIFKKLTCLVNNKINCKEYNEKGELIFDGQIINQQREGIGKFYQDNVLRYDGTWGCGLVHGVGTEYWESGRKRYEGCWWQGLRHGVGTLYADMEGSPILYSGKIDNGNFEKFLKLKKNIKQQLNTINQTWLW